MVDLFIIQSSPSFYLYARWLQSTFRTLPIVYIKMSQRRGTCSFCWSEFKVQRSTGLLHKHGPRDRPCPGSDTTLVSSSVNHDVSSASQNEIFIRQPYQRDRTLQDLPSTDTTSATDPDTNNTIETELLSRPSWTRLIERNPKAARNAHMILLNELVDRSMREPTNLAAWNELLHFGPLILSKPPRGGSSRNLSSVISKRVSSLKDLITTITRHKNASATDRQRRMHPTWQPP